MNGEVTAAWLGAVGALVAAVASAAFAARSAASSRQHDKEMESLRSELARAERQASADQDAQKVVETFRRPLLAAAVEFKRRLGNILHGAFFAYLGADSRRSRMALLSTAYRMAAYLGWRELLSRRLTYLHYEDSERTKTVISLLEDVSTQLARDDWVDLMVWKDEQRAIGGLMLNEDGTGVIGFEAFYADFDSKFAPWLEPFIEDLQRPETDGPGGRLAAVATSLDSLISDLDSDGIYEGRA